jgi:SulP family sulfate permease
MSDIGRGHASSLSEEAQVDRLTAMADDPRSWYPKSFVALAQYDSRKFVADLIAGLTVGLVALPLAMAFAISSGVSPQAGIYTAIVAGFLCSALGGSSTQVSGPTGAFVVVVFGIVQQHGVNGLAICTVMAGVILIGLGVTGLGSAVKFIPRPVIVGFTNGIALLIASTQIKDFFGLNIPKVPGDFLGRIAAITDAFHTLQWPVVMLASGCLLTLILFQTFVKRIPGSIIVLAAATLLAFLLKLPVETIGSRFGGIPQGLPSPRIPEFSIAAMQSLISPAVTVAMLGAIESLMSAVVSDRMTGDRHNPNIELVAQGIGNIASPIFGGIPATGAIARTATNVRSGAKTPISGMIHALTLVVVLLLAAPLANHIPIAVLAAILMLVSYNMGEWREIPHVLSISRADGAVWLVTFFLTVFADLTVAVQAGMILAGLLYISKVTKTTTVARVTDDYLKAGKEHLLTFDELPEGVAIFRIHGPFLFGSTDKLDEIRDAVEELPRVVILRLRNMNAIDGTGIQALEHFAHVLQRSGRSLILCGIREQPDRLLRKAKFDEVIGPENYCSSVRIAIDRARQLAA